MRSARLIGVVTLIAWVTSLHLLIPLPSQRIASWSQDSRATAQAVQQEAARTGLSATDVERVLLLKMQREKEAVWVKWLAFAVIAIAGIAAATTALRAHPMWRFACAATSLVYLMGWIAALSGVQFLDNQTLLDAYVSSLSNHLAAGFASAVAFVQKDILAPLIHFLVAVFLLYERVQA